MVAEIEPDAVDTPGRFRRAFDALARFDGQEGVVRGRIVKRLGDGVMAVLGDAGEAVDAALEASRAVAGISVNGYSPAPRGGIHFGRPRKLGDDY